MKTSVIVSILVAAVAAGPIDRRTDLAVRDSNWARSWGHHKPMYSGTSSTTTTTAVSTTDNTEADVTTTTATAPSTYSTSTSSSGTAMGDTSATSGGKSIISSINDFRSKAGLPDLAWDDQLAQNSATTGEATDGKSMVHQLIPPTMGQVLSPGSSPDCAAQGGYTPFELAFYSWLCESPSYPALGGICPTLLGLSHISVSGTGHFDILTSTSYTKIGCAFTQNPDAGSCDLFAGIWGCDVTS